MTVRERSAGPLYFATEKTIKRLFKPHYVGIVEMCSPWRAGWAIALPTGTMRMLVIGHWTRTIEDEMEVDFPNEWPDFMQSWDIDDTELNPPWVIGGGKLKPRMVTNETEEEAGPRGVEESER